MREIKFRTYNKKTKKLSEPFNLTEFAQDQDSEYGNWELYNELYPDSFEFIQYTGLKDKNGKEIYEGDITSIKEHMNPLVEIQKAVVTWDKETTGFLGIGFFPWNMVEVIGNIYENPELLKE